MLTELTLKSLAELDGGKIGKAFAIHARKLTDDCIDRPGSKAPRKLTIDLIVTPVLDPNTGECDDVNVEAEIGSKVPKHRSRPINCQVRKTHKGGQLVFNDFSLDNVDQRTLDQQSPTFTDPPAGDPPATDRPTPPQS